MQEMLGRGIIQDSYSHFASLLVLMGKRDAIWRLCVDYRALNKKTIDELVGATIFTKLDLRASNQQLTVHLDGVYKIAFKTHIGHYEILVMPFGLTNEHASFQTWMNPVFKYLLRKCLIILFLMIL